MDRLTAIRIFLNVADLGSFTRAAEKFDLSRSKVSKLVAALESQLSTRLIERTTRRVRLTEAGEIYYQRMCPLLAEFDEADSEISLRGSEIQGRLRISVPLDFGRLRLLPLLAEFNDSHPRLELDVDFSDRLVDLYTENFDAVIRIGRIQNSTLIGRKLGLFTVRVVASPDFWRKHGKPEQPRDLEGYAALIYNLTPNADVWELGVEKVRVNRVFSATNGEILARMAIRGAGVIYQPDFIVDSFVKSGELEAVLDAYCPVIDGIYLLYTQRRFVPAKLRALIKFLSEELQDGSENKPAN